MQKTFPQSLLRLTMTCLLFCMLSNSGYASHVMGSDLTFTCIGPNQYRINLRVFRDCSGISMPTSFVVSYSSASCGTSGSVNTSLISSSDITPLCTSQTSICSGGSSPIGVEQYIYQGTLTLPSGCNDWVLSTSTCCRNSAITNVTSPATNDFYIRTQLNNTLSPCNSSPQFASAPTPFTCTNQPVRYQQLATDPDGDSLVYSLTNCLQGSGTSVTYAPGRSGTNPLTSPVTINPSNGELSFNVATPQIAAICVRVEEYRNGVKVGEIIRDLQFVIQNCTNQLPSLSGINNVPNVFSTSVCEGSNICFNVLGTDPNVGDVLSMSIIGSIPGSTFTQTGSGNNRTGTFCWTPPVGSAGSYSFSVQLADNACPIPGLTSRTYTVNVYSNPNPPVNAGPDVQICAGQSTVLTATTAAGNVSSFQWSPALGLSTTVGPVTTATPAATTNYTATLFYTDGCRSTDNVLVTIAPDPVANVSPNTGNVCPGGSFTLTGTPRWARSALVQYPVAVQISWSLYQQHRAPIPTPFG